MQRLEKVQQERDLYADLYDFAPCGYFICNKQGRILDANQTGVLMLGRWKRELLAMSFSDCIDHEDVPVLDRLCCALYETGKQQTCELRLVQKNGAVFWAKLECMVLGGTAGPDAGEVRIIATDLSTIKRTQTALQCSEERYFELLDLTPHGINEVDLVGRIIYTNPAFAVMHGYGSNEIVGMQIWDLLADREDKQELQNHLTRLIEQQPPPAPVFLKNRRKDGKAIEIQVDWTYRRDAHQNLLGFVSVITDISERVEAEKSMQAAKEGLEREVESRTRAFRDTIIELRKEVTVRKMAQTALRESEDRFLAMMQASNDIICICNPEGQIIIANRAAERLLGYAPEEVLMRPMAEFIHPEDRRDVERDFLAILDGRKVKEREHRLRRKDSSWLQVEASGFACSYGNDRYVGAIIRDISRRARHEGEQRHPTATPHILREEALQKEAQWAQKIKEYAINSSVNAICFIDLNGTITYVNQAFLYMWGLENQEEAIGKDVLEIWHEPGEGRIFWKTVMKKSLWRGQLTARRWDDSVFYVYLSANLLRDESGLPVGMMGAFVDISQQKKAELALLESERRYRSIFEVSTDGICIVEKNAANNCKKVVDCNESYARMAGLAKAELLALPCIREKQIILDPNLVPLECGGKKEGIEQCQGNFSWRRSDGRENYIECRGTPIVVNGQTFSLCVHREYTRRRKAEEEIKNLSSQLLQVAEEERKRIARDLHDEFGQFLPALRYRLENFQHSLPESSAAQHDEFVKITELIEKLGTMARNISHDLRPSLLDDFGLVPTIEAGVAEFAERHEKMQVTFRVAGAQKKIFSSLEIVLYRVFQEAMNNVAKHSWAKKVTVSLTFSYPSIILMVADDGVGFDPQPLDLPRKRRERGGIGLLGMHERIASVDGKLTIRSGQGKGTLIRAEIYQKWKRTEDRCWLRNGRQCIDAVE